MIGWREKTKWLSRSMALQLNRPGHVFLCAPATPVTNFSRLAIESTLPHVNHPGVDCFGLFLRHPNSHPLREYSRQAARNALAWGLRSRFVLAIILAGPPNSMPITFITKIYRKGSRIRVLYEKYQNQNGQCIGTNPHHRWPRERQKRAGNSAIGVNAGACRSLG